MARAIWSGSISFGMVTIPVKLYGATESKDIAFNLLHSTCGREVVTSPEAPETKVIDLVDALRRSVEAAKKSTKSKTAAHRPSRPAARRRTRKVS